MKKILIPTDFSENAYNALEYGVRLFAEEDCVFHLLYTYTPALYNSGYLVDPSLSINEIYKQDGLRSIARVVKRIKKDHPNKKHSFRKISSFNFLQDEIKEQVKASEIDLIIMGTQGATGAARILFGTHTVHAIKGAICPLIAVPSNFEYTEPKNLLFPSDYESDLKEDDLKILKEISQKFEAKIHILHVTGEFPLDSEQKKNKKALDEFLRDTLHDFVKIDNQTVPQAIIHFQEKKPVDLLVMLRYKHSFFHNLFFRPLINKIGFQITTPFLVIPVNKEKIKPSGNEKDLTSH